jgi:DNA ligase-1
MNTQGKILESKRFLELLDIIKNYNSTNNKLSCLKEAFRESSSNQRATMKHFFNMVYSPFIIFGIKTIPEKLLKQKPSIFLHPISNIQEAMNKITQVFLIDKTKGNSGKEELYRILKACDKETAELVKMIIQRDLKIGITTRTINKAIPGCLPVAEYMGAVPFTGMNSLNRLLAQYRDKTGQSAIIIYAQEKADGLFSFINTNKFSKKGYTEGSVMSRRLKPIGVSFKEIQMEIKEFSKAIPFKDITIHGEFTIDGIDRLTANGVYKALTTIETKKADGLTPAQLKKYTNAFEETFGCSIPEIHSRIRFSIWDITNDQLVDNFDNGDRFEYVLYGFNKAKSNSGIEFKHLKPIEYKKLTSLEMDKVIEYFGSLLEQGKEGIILKIKDGYFKAGKPNYCIKFKNEFSSDYKIVGFDKGTGKYKNTLGCIIVESQDGLCTTRVPGFNDTLKDEIWNNQDKYLGKIVEVRANDYSLSEDNIKEDGTEIYSLMHPRFVSFRMDKDKANTIEEIKKERNSFKIIQELLKEVK